MKVELHQPVARPAHRDAVVALHIHLNGVAVVHHRAVARGVVELHRFGRALQGAAFFDVDRRLPLAGAAEAELGLELAPGRRAVFAFVGPVRFTARAVRMGGGAVGPDHHGVAMAGQRCGAGLNVLAAVLAGGGLGATLRSRLRPAAGDIDGELLLGGDFLAQRITKLGTHLFGVGCTGGRNLAQYFLLGGAGAGLGDRFGVLAPSGRATKRCQKHSAQRQGSQRAQRKNGPLVQADCCGGGAIGHGACGLSIKCRCQAPARRAARQKGLRCLSAVSRGLFNRGGCGV